MYKDYFKNKPHLKNIRHELRQKYLKSLGYRILRYTNRAVSNELAAVLEDIIEHCKKREKELQ